MVVALLLLLLMGKPAIAIYTASISNVPTAEITSIWIPLIGSFFLTLNPHLQTHLRVITDNIFIGFGHNVAQTVISGS